MFSGDDDDEEEEAGKDEVKRRWCWRFVFSLFWFCCRLFSSCDFKTSNGKTSRSRFSAWEMHSDHVFGVFLYSRRRDLFSLTYFFLYVNLQSNRCAYSCAGTTFHIDFILMLEDILTAYPDAESLSTDISVSFFYLWYSKIDIFINVCVRVCQEDHGIIYFVASCWVSILIWWIRMSCPLTLTCQDGHVTSRQLQ